MTPELRYFIDYHKTPRRIRWNVMAVCELAGMLAAFALMLGVGYVGFYFIWSMF